MGLQRPSKAPDRRQLGAPTRLLMRGAARFHAVWEGQRQATGWRRRRPVALRRRSCVGRGLCSVLPAAVRDLVNATIAALGGTRSEENDNRTKFTKIAHDCVFVPMRLETFGQFGPGASPGRLRVRFTSNRLASFDLRHHRLNVAVKKGNCSVLCDVRRWLPRCISGLTQFSLDCDSLPCI